MTSTLLRFLWIHFIKYQVKESPVQLSELLDYEL